MENLGIVLCIEANLSHENNDGLLEFGSKLCNASSLPIELFHTIEHEESSVHSSRYKDVEQYITKSLNYLSKTVCNKISYQITFGDFKESLVDFYSSSKLIVLGKSGLTNKNNNLSDLGSNLEAIITQSTSPVLIHKKNKSDSKSENKNKKENNLDNILLAFDGRASIAKVTECPIFLSLAKCAKTVHVVSIDNNLPLLEEQHGLLCEELTGCGIAVKSVFIRKSRESVAQKLSNYEDENDIDLTVIGAFAKKKVRPFFLGSQTSELLKKINSSIMFYR